MRRTALFVAAVAAVPFLGSCAAKKTGNLPVETAPVTRRDIVVTAQATGTVEPVDTVAVKSQASGLIISMPVEVGSQVKPGDLLAQIDTRNLRNDYDRIVATQRAAQATLQVTSAALARAKQLFAQKVITATEYEAAVVAEANARSALTSAQTNLRTSQQNLQYATIRAEVGGIVISKNASVGSVVSSAVSTFGGGSTVLTLANLERVRMRALVNETDIGNVTAGMPVSVTIDAFPSRRFAGQVEKVEPQAVVQQSVTMFPVLISLQNADRALLPGMNGQVSIVTQQRQNVLAIPNDAVRSTSDVAAAASVLGLNPDSLRAMVRSGSRSRGGDTGVAAAGQSQDGQAGADGSRRRRRRGSATGGGAGGAGGGEGGARTSGGAEGGAGGAAGGAAGGGAAPAGAGAGGAGPQIVFVKQGNSWAPRAVRLGVSDFDYSEVLRGLQEGDQVALLSTLVAQAQRDQVGQRVRAMTGNGLPGTGGGSAPRGGGGGGGGGGHP